MSGEPGGAAARHVLAVNAGSSSLKFGLYAEDTEHAIWSGQFEGLEPAGQPRWRTTGGEWAALPAAADAGAAAAGPSMARALAVLVPAARSRSQRLAAVAHRIVHGGERCIAPCPLDPATLAYLHTLDALAPLHQPHNLAGVQAFASALPGLPQIGCFDTAFHATLPPLEQALPLPPAATAGGVRRYGFHGLSYEYLAGVLPRVSGRAGGRVLLAHLGNGASLCALRSGRSVATTMGFSALEGLMMGSRSGSLDPGVLLHLLRGGMAPERLERMLYRESGLLGVSGLSADMRTLRASPEPAAARAIALFTHRIVREAGALITLLGGVDLVAFTGGIGEHDAALRADIARALSFLGVALDETANAAAVGRGVQALHAARSAIELWVVPTDEGRVAARAAFGWLDREALINAPRS